MNTSEIRKMSLENMRKELLETTRELFNLRMQKKFGQATQTHKFKQTKRLIARLKTIMNESTGQ